MITNTMQEWEKTKWKDDLKTILWNEIEWGKINKLEQTSVDITKSLQITLEGYIRQLLAQNTKMVVEALREAGEGVRVEDNCPLHDMHLDSSWHVEHSEVAMIYKVLSAQEKKAKELMGE